MSETTAKDSKGVSNTGETGREATISRFWKEFSVPLQRTSRVASRGTAAWSGMEKASCSLSEETIPRGV